MRRIDADELKKKLRLVQDSIENDENILKAVFNLIDKAPTVYMPSDNDITDFYPKRLIIPQGEWILLKGYDYKCSLCGEVERAEKNFCPNCGAEMREKVSI